MSGYLIRRIASSAVTYLGITIAVFLMIRAAPGDPASLYAGLRPGDPVPAEILREIRAEHGLDRPLGRQYLHWLGRTARLDFGESIRHRRPVREVIAERIPATLLLNGLALVTGLAIAIPLGAGAARRHGSLFDRATAIGLLLLYSLPPFWLALLLIDFLSVRLGLLPLLGMGPERGADGTLAWLGERTRHLILPVTVLACGQIAIFSRFVRSSLLEVMGEEYVRTARAKGAPESSVVWKHAFRNTLGPLISLGSVVIPWLLSGSVIVEYIFQWDGAGRLFFSAILSRDYPLVMGLTVLTAVVTLLVALVADLVAVAVDPRIRLERKVA